MTLFVLVGLPGSGKTTWLQEKSLPALSSDELRARLTGDAANQENNRLVFATLRRLCEARLRAGCPETYIDSTALTLRERRCWIRWAELHGCRVEAVFFDVPVTVCAERNARRHRVVPEEAMARMAARLVPPRVVEGFAQVTVVRM
jgi:predicted kinase